MATEVSTQTGVKVQLSGQDGNIFSIVGRCSREMKKAGFSDAATEMSSKVMASGSYDEALQIIMRYCDVN